MFDFFSPVISRLFKKSKFVHVVLNPGDFVHSALRNKGIQPVLDAITDYLPSPDEVPPVTGIDPRDGKELQRSPSDSSPFAALAFKIVSDPFVGRLVYFRVYSGKAEAGSQVYNSRSESNY